ncbi:MAG: hypothetical protein ACLVJH_17400 [Faecalibacterium prausnitzii]
MGFLDIRIERTDAPSSRHSWSCGRSKPLEKIKVKELCDPSLHQ